jgi:hypothetical protein
MQKDLAPIVENFEDGDIKGVNYLSIECNYQLKDASNKKDAINFVRGQINSKDGFAGTSVISCSIQDARNFAYTILQLCDDIDFFSSRDN